MHLHIDADEQTITIHFNAPRRFLPSVPQLVKFAATIASYPAVKLLGHVLGWW